MSHPPSRLCAARDLARPTQSHQRPAVLDFGRCQLHASASLAVEAGRVTDRRLRTATAPRSGTIDDVPIVGVLPLDLRFATETVADEDDSTGIADARHLTAASARDVGS